MARRARVIGIEIQDCENSSGERNLWLAVLLLAKRDLKNVWMAGVGLNAQEICKQQALTYFSIDNVDFITICDLAGIDPQFTLEEIKGIRNHGIFKRVSH